MAIICTVTGHTEEEARLTMEARRGKNLKLLSEKQTPGKTLMWTYETHHGLCLEDRERNFHNDSDFYMLVWNPETKAIDEINYATTRGWSYPCYASRADATPEAIAAATEFTRQRHLEDLRWQDVATAKKVVIGKRIKVIKGWKVPQGTEGKVFWIGSTEFGVAKYKTNRITTYRVGFKTDAGETCWTSMSNVEVAEYEQYLTVPAI